MGTEEKPWIWAVVIVAILLPIIMIYLLCCTGSKDDNAAVYKKTDEVLPDDESADSQAIDEVSEEVLPESGGEENKMKTDDGDVTPNVEEVADHVQDQVDEKKVDIDEKEMVSNVEVNDISEKESDATADIAPIEDISSADSPVITNGNVEDSNTELNQKEEEIPIISQDNDSSKESSVEEVSTHSEKVEANGVDTIEDTSVPEEIPHSSPKTRAARKKIRKDS